MKKTVLIIEDDRDINELIRYNLKKEGFDVIPVYDGAQAVEVCAAERPDLVLLDLMIPLIDGLEVCRIVKQDVHTKHVPIIMITAKGEESDIVLGLQMGADDYIPKPFSPKVLLARIKAVLRRAGAGVASVDQKERRSLGDIQIDLPKRKVSLMGDQVDLTLLEFDILEFLSRSPGRVFTRDQILEKVWKDGKFIIDRAVDVHIRGLRKKMGRAEDYIETIRGVGYRFKEFEMEI